MNNLENTNITNEEAQIKNTAVKTKEKTGFASSIYEGLSVVISAVFIIALIFTFVFRLVGVNGRSMNETLQHGDWLVVTPYYTEPQYGDIVISTHVLDELGPIVKRVIATEGDVVDCDAFGNYYVNGEKLNESYAVYAGSIHGDLSYPLVVPDGHVMLLGDNRVNSKDSRFSSVGFAPVDSLLGKAQIRLDKKWNIYSNFNN